MCLCYVRIYDLNKIEDKYLFFYILHSYRSLPSSVVSEEAAPGGSITRYKVSFQKLHSLFSPVVERACYIHLFCWELQEKLEKKVMATREYLRLYILM